MLKSRIHNVPRGRTGMKERESKPSKYETPEDFRKRKRKNLYTYKWKWVTESVKPAEELMIKHILPKVASDIILPIAELDQISARLAKIGRRGERLYDLGIKYKATEDWLSAIARICLRMEYFTAILRELAEDLNRATLPMFPSYVSKFKQESDVRTSEEKVLDTFRSIVPVEREEDNV